MSIVFAVMFGAGILFAFSGSVAAQKKAAEFKELYDLKSKAQRSLYFAAAAG